MQTRVALNRLHVCQRHGGCRCQEASRGGARPPRSSKVPSRKGCRRTRAERAFKRYGHRLAEWPGFAQTLLEAGFHCV